MTLRRFNLLPNADAPVEGSFAEGYRPIIEIDDATGTLYIAGAAQSGGVDLNDIDPGTGQPAITVKSGVVDLGPSKFQMGTEDTLDPVLQSYVGAGNVMIYRNVPVGENTVLGIEIDATAYGEVSGIYAAIMGDYCTAIEGDGNLPIGAVGQVVGVTGWAGPAGEQVATGTGTVTGVLGQAFGSLVDKAYGIQAEINFGDSYPTTEGAALYIFDTTSVAPNVYAIKSDGGRICFQGTPVPATATSPGTIGEVAFDDTNHFIYRCYATNQWSRVAMATSW